MKFRLLLSVTLITLTSQFAAASENVALTRENDALTSASQSDSEVSTSTSPTSPTASLSSIYPSLKDLDTLPWINLPGGVRYQDVHVGKGAFPKPGCAVYLHIRGYLEDGTVFEDTFRRKKYFAYTFGSGEVMAAVEAAMATMQEGGKRRMWIPSDLAYGEAGYTPPPDGDRTVVIPPNADLLFEMTFLWMREPEIEKLDKFR